MILFGNILQELRNKKAWSQVELAKRLGISASQIANYEIGRRFPSLEILISASHIFGVSTDYLLGLESSKRKVIDVSELTTEEINSICLVVDCFKTAHEK